MKICIEGCAHGDLDRIYHQIGIHERMTGTKVDLLICCGDFQATRNVEDLACMAVPPKYLDMCSFYKYHQGEAVAPVLTIFIGGNHEASNHLQELAYGGWVAPNIYYLGYAGVVQVNGIRIAGISGIYRGYNYEKGHFEITPYTQDTVRSVYSIRKFEVFRLSQLTPGKIDIMLSHDWPSNIWEHGDNSKLGTKEGLLRFKPAFREDMESGRLGSRPCWELLQKLKPSNWFAAHMHCRFNALVKHDGDQETKFVALDKCLPRRNCFEFFDIGEEVTERNEDGSAKLDFCYDPEWLTILRLTNRYLNCTSSRTMIPMATSAERWNYNPTQQEIDETIKMFNDDLSIPHNFRQMAQGYDPQWDRDKIRSLRMPTPVLNPQTTEFCDKLGIDDPLDITARFNNLDIKPKTFENPEAAFEQSEEKPKSKLELPKPVNSEEIDLDLTDDDEDNKDSAIDLSKDLTPDTPKAIKRSKTPEQKPPSPPPVQAPINSSNNVPSSAKKFKRRNQEIRNEDNE